MRNSHDRIFREENELKEQLDDPYNFPKIIPSDEIWYYGYDLEVKQ